MQYENLMHACMRNVTSVQNSYSYYYYSVYLLAVGADFIDAANAIINKAVIITVFIVQCLVEINLLSCYTYRDS